MVGKLLLGNHFLRAINISSAKITHPAAPDAIHTSDGGVFCWEI